MEELVGRIRGTNVSKEYEKLQAKYAQLTKDLEALKRSVVTIATQPQKETDVQLEAVREKIREVEWEFRTTQKSERSFYLRLLSGNELATELQKQILAEHERQEREHERQKRETQRRQQAERALNAVIKTLEEDGHDVEVGAPRVINKGELVGLEFKIKANASEAGKTALVGLLEHEDVLTHEDCERLHQTFENLALVVAVTLNSGERYSAEQPGFHNYRKYFCWHDWKKAAAEVTAKERALVVDVPSNRISDVRSVEGHIKPEGQELCEAGKNRTTVKSPRTSITVYGIKDSFYVDRVNGLIARWWMDPPVDIKNECVVAVVKFRLARTGLIRDVSLKRSSGNQWIDQAAMKAVLGAYQLPPFPPNITGEYRDAHYTVAIGTER
jgi:TonB family protein